MSVILQDYMSVRTSLLFLPGFLRKLSAHCHLHRTMACESSVHGSTASSTVPTKHRWSLSETKASVKGVWHDTQNQKLHPSGLAAGVLTTNAK